MSWECEAHEKGHYNRYPKDGYNDPPDAGPLNYSGHFAIAVCNDANGAG